MGELGDSRLVRREQWLGAGHSPSEIRARLRSGSYVRVYAGVYRASDGATDGRSTLDEEHDLIRAVAGRTKTLVISDRSSGMLHGLALPRPTSLMVELTRDAVSGGSRKGIRHVHARPLKDGDVVEVDGIRTTSVARTLLDLSCTLDQRQAVAAIDDALHRKLVDPVALGAALAGVNRRVGAQAARRAFAMADGLAESVGESFLRVVMKELGLPEPDLQVVVRGPRGEFIARVDLAYPNVGVIIEFDGQTKYTALLRPGQSASDVVIAEKDRENRLLECGYIVIRVVWKELFRPSELEARIQRAIARGRRAMTAGLIVGTMTVPESLRIPGC